MAISSSGAKAQLDEMDAVAEKLMTTEPVPMLSAGRFSTYVNYMRRFFRPCTQRGHQRVTSGNRMVAAAHDQWQFQIDPAKVGEDIGLWRPELTGGLWQTIKLPGTGLRQIVSEFSAIGCSYVRQNVGIGPSTVWRP